MRDKRSGKFWVVGLVALLLLSLPLAAAAQTTSGTSGTATTSAATTNGITNPKDGATVSGTVEVKGNASSPDFMKWQLDLLPNGDPNAAIFLAVGEAEGAFTYSLDTSNLPAGEHSLRLRVVRQDSNYDEYFTKFTIGQAAAGAGAKASTGTTGGAASTTGGTAGTTTGTGATTPTAGATKGATTSGAAASGVGVTANGLAAPREGQAISGQFEVRGYANDPNFMKWQLDLLPNADPNAAIFLALGETPGVFTYTLNTTDFPEGKHALRLRVVRNDSNYTEYTTNFTIGPAAAGTGAKGASAAATSGTTTSGGATGAATGTTSGATGGGATTGTTGATGTGGGATAAQPANGITAPKDGATISGTVTVRGYANDPNFMKWQLDLLPNGDATQAMFLAFGEEPGEFTYSLDASGLPAGEHMLRLRVVRTDSNYNEYFTKFTIK